MKKITVDVAVAGAGSRVTYAMVSGRITGESVPEYIERNF